MAGLKEFMIGRGDKAEQTAIAGVLICSRVPTPGRPDHTRVIWRRVE